MEDRQLLGLIGEVYETGSTAANIMASAVPKVAPFAQLLKRMLEVYDPNRPRDLINLARSASVPEAVPFLSRGAFYMMLGDMEMAAGDLDNAKTHLLAALPELKAVSTNPRVLAYIHNMIATAYYHKRSWINKSATDKEILKHLDEAISLDPGNANYRNMRSQIKS